MSGYKILQQQRGCESQGGPAGISFAVWPAATASGKLWDGHLGTLTSGIINSFLVVTAHAFAQVIGCQDGMGPHDAWHPRRKSLSGLDCEVLPLECNRSAGQEQALKRT